MYIFNNATATPVAATSTWYKVDAGWTVGIERDINVDIINDQVTIEHADVYNVDISLSSSAASANQTIQYGVAVNGTVQNKSVIERRHSTSDVGAASVQCALDLSIGDDVSLMVLNSTSTANITVSYCNMRVSHA